jgi:exodeoxyribonuclease VII large subunit
MFGQLNLFSGSSSSQPYTVSQLTGHIRRLLEADADLRDLWLEGEISNFQQAHSGHCYFTLKDGAAEISCVMWKGIVARQRQLPADGDLVVAHGNVSVYEARGRYQLYVDRMRLAGIGDLYQQFEQLKARLQAEGLFAPERKRSLPRFPRRIGVVTSPTAAALRDIVSVLQRRYPLSEVVLSPTLVQGEAAPALIVAALDLLNQRADVDVIIVARGGGSLEELWPFNDEKVARAVADSRIPVICGVGHETDISLADFAADVRAPTPSAAAEVAVPDQADLRTQVAEMVTAAGALLSRAVNERRLRLVGLTQSLGRASPLAQLVRVRQRVDELISQSDTALRHSLAIHRERLAGLARQLSGVGPLRTIERGYAIVRRIKEGDIVRSVRQVAAGDSLGIRVVDGEFGAQVREDR